VVPGIDRPSEGPEPPSDIDPAALDRTVREELRSLSRAVADKVARHLIAAGTLLEEDPEQAFAHALAARRLAARVAVVREAAGVAAYHAGEWQAAIAELRTYHRMTGRYTHLALLADCERALGRPERAVDLYRNAPVLPPAERLELLMVAAGARSDLGQPEAAVALLRVPELDGTGRTAARLRYAYADALLAAGRPEESREWFARAAEVDDDAVTDAAERLWELDGIVVTDVDDDPGAGLLDTAAPDETATPDDTTSPPDGPGAPGPAAGPAAPAAELSATVAGPAAPVAHRRLVDAYDLVVLDLDGVVIIGEELVPGAAAIIARLREEGVPLRYATNNASRAPEEVARLLRRLGVEASPDEVSTSAMLAAALLADRLPPGSPVLVVGSEALGDQVRRVGLRLVGGDGRTPAAVVQGYSPDVAWTDLADACVAIRAGAWWVATNTDRTLPSPRGPLPGNGALVAALAAALSRDPDRVVGKPDPAFFASVAELAGSRRPLVVGDRLDTDIAGARAAGMDSLLVLTGVTGAGEARSARGDQRPTHIGDDLGALLAPRELSGAGGA
jgi:glycerol-1-phosphatase